jgi:hypothetical protein
MTNQVTVPAIFIVYGPRRILGRCDLEAELATQLKGTAKHNQSEQPLAKEPQC